MNKEKIRLLQEFLTTQMNYWAFFPIILTVYLFLSGVSAPSPLLVFFFLALSFLPYFYYFVRTNVGSSFLHLILHAAPIVLLWFLPFESMLPRILCMLLGGGFALYSVCLRLFYRDSSDDEYLPPAVPVLISGVCMFLQSRLGISRCRAVYPILLIFVLSLFFLLFFIEKYFHFLAMNESSASHIPEEAIFHSGIRQVLAFTVCGALTLLLTSGIVWLEKPISLLKAGALALLRFIFRFIELKDRPEAQPTQIMPIDTNMAETFYAETETGTFWLWDLLFYLISFAIAVFLFLVLLKFVKQFWNYLKYKVNTLLSDEEEEDGEPVVQELRERLKESHGKKKNLFSFFSFMSNNEKVRKLYRKQAMRLNSDAFRLRRITARECAGYMNAPVMGDVYEKARYSGQDCTADDIKRMKAACRKAEVPGERI